MIWNIPPYDCLDASLDDITIEKLDFVIFFVSAWAEEYRLAQLPANKHTNEQIY